MALSIDLPLPAYALDLPVRRAGQEAPAPAYQGDRIEIRLVPTVSGVAYARMTAAEALATRDRASRPGTPIFLESLGIPSIDRIGGTLGGFRFEREFQGESPPAPGVRAIDFTAFYIVHLSPLADLETALRRLRALPEIASADPIAVLPVSVFPNDSLWNASSWFYDPSRHDVHAPEAWDVTTGDTSIVVGVLDTGVLPYHPDLGGRLPGERSQIWTNPEEASGVPGEDDDRNGFVDDVHGWDFVDLGSNLLVSNGEDWDEQDNDPNDFAGHGTMVAGLVGALSNNTIGVTGTAWKVRILPLRIGWSTSRSPLGEVSMDFVAKAIRYATRMEVKLINCSFATINQSGLFAAVDDALAHGVTIVAAAGNDGQAHFLAAREDVVAVGASGPGDFVATFSNRGEYVDLVAPGKDVASTFVQVPRATGPDSLARRQPGYGVLEGTSLSAPIVTGGIALLQALRRSRVQPAMDPMDVLLRLRETTDDISTINSADSGYGTGRLDLHRLLVDPQASSANRIGGPSVGPAVMLMDASGERRVMWATGDGKLLMLAGRRDTVRVVTLPAAPISGVAAADLAPGRAGVFVSLVDGRVAGFDGRGDPLPGWPVSVTAGSGTLSIPVLGDLDGDGTIEVVCATSSGRVFAWRTSGVVVAPFPRSIGSGVVGSPALSDVDGVPGVEIIASNELGELHVLRGNGVPLQDWPIQPGAPNTAPIVIGLGADSVAIVLGAAGNLIAVSPDASVLFSTPVSATPGNGVAEEPAAADIDGDGLDEIVVVTHDPAVAVFDRAGRILGSLGFPRPLPSAASGPPVIGRLIGSSDGGFHQQIVTMTSTGLTVVNEHAVLARSFPKPGNAGEFPTLVDLDGTGVIQVLAGTGIDSMLFVYNGEGMGSTVGGWFTPRGNFARTASRVYAPPLTALDYLPPAAIADLAADSVGLTSVVLEWHAPGDDGPIGKAASYELRHATFALDESNFETGEPVPGLPAPGPAGTLERFRVQGLEKNVTYHFALRTRDDAGNLSPLSNVIQVRTGVGPPLSGRTAPAIASRATPSRLPVELLWLGPGNAGPQKIRILDLAGRVIRTLDLDSSEGGAVQWNGRDDRGRLVPAGMYLARLICGSFHAHTRIVLLP